LLVMWLSLMVATIQPKQIKEEQLEK